MHFFSRFFKTLGILITKPGFLSTEYKSGNRAGYTNPFLMYLIIPGLFFIVFFAGFRDKKISLDTGKGKNIVNRGTVKILKEGYKNAKTKEDSLTIERTIKSLEARQEKEDDDEDLEGLGSGMFDFYDTTYKSVAAYDSAQRLLPPGERDGWFEKTAWRRDIILSERYRNGGEHVWIEVTNKFIHYFPYLVFILLPLFALFLKLFYIRRKKFSFGDHNLFLVHVHSFMFIFMLLYLCILLLKQFTDSDRLAISAIVIFIIQFIYSLRAMKNFYEQSWPRTLFKFLLFSILSIAAVLAAFFLFFSFSVSWL